MSVLRVLAAGIAACAIPAALASAHDSATVTRPPAFRVEPGARLYVPAETPAAGRAAAWVVFRTSPHVNARLTVVRVGARSGRSYAASGAANCIRAAVPSRSSSTGPTAGRRYRVSFSSRAGTGRTAARRLVTTRLLTARVFAAPPTGLGTPHC